MTRRGDRASGGAVVENAVAAADVAGCGCCVLACRHRCIQGVFSVSCPFHVCVGVIVDMLVCVGYGCTGLPSMFRFFSFYRCRRRKLSAFVQAVRAKYHDHRFHNFFHGFSAMHAAFLMMTRVRFPRPTLPLRFPVIGDDH